MRYTDCYWMDVDKVIAHIPNVNLLQGKTILITGATGMICSAVAEILFRLNREENFETKILLAGRSEKKMKGRFQQFREGKDYCYIPYDPVKDFVIDTYVDYIIHGASNAEMSVFVAAPVEMMDSNLLGTRNLLNFMSKKKTKRMLYISSSAVYGKRPNNEAIKEDEYGGFDILDIHGVYTMAKCATEMLCKGYVVERGLDCVIARPCHVYGPSFQEDDQRAVAQFARCAANRENIVLTSDGMPTRSNCYTLDCGSGILSVLLNGEKGSAYNIANPRSVSTIRGLAEQFADAAGVHVVYAHPEDEFKKGYTMIDRAVIDTARLQRLGWDACFDLKEGIQRTIEMINKDEDKNVKNKNSGGEMPR